MILRDLGNGLGHACNVGLSKSSERYILNCESESIARLLRFSGCLIDGTTLAHRDREWMLQAGVGPRYPE